MNMNLVTGKSRKYRLTAVLLASLNKLEKGHIDYY